MEHIRIPRQSLIIVCDGSKALMLRNAGDALRPDLKLEDSFVLPQFATRELGSDRPGRVYQSVGGARSSVAGADLHTAYEEAFFVKIAGILDKAVQENGEKNLIIVAPPKALGVLRRSFSEKVRAAVIAEVAKDLVQMPVSEIERHLSV